MICVECDGELRPIVREALGGRPVVCRREQLVSGKHELWFDVPLSVATAALANLTVVIDQRAMPS